jgi:hypothetical protein
LTVVVERGHRAAYPIIEPYSPGVVPVTGGRKAKSVPRRDVWYAFLAFPGKKTHSIGLALQSKRYAWRYGKPCRTRNNQIEASAAKGVRCGRRQHLRNCRQ